MIFKQIYLTHRNITLKGTTTPDQSGSGSNGNERVLDTFCIPEEWPRHQMQFRVIRKIYFSFSFFFRVVVDITLFGVVFTISVKLRQLGGIEIEAKLL